MARSKLPTRTVRVLAIAWFGTMLMVVSCVLLGVWFAFNRNAPLQPISQPPTPTVELPAPRPAVANSYESDSFGYGIEIYQTLDNMARVDDLGLNWVKINIHWANWERQPGQVNWDALNAQFEAAAAQDLNVMVSISGAPIWAATAGGDPDRGISPPAIPETYANFVKQLIRRNQGNIHAVEVWPTPNIRSQWQTNRPLSSDEYMVVLATTSEAIREVDPRVMIISGGLMPTPPDSVGEAINDVAYLESMLERDMLTYVDCVGVQLPGYNIPPATPFDAIQPDPTQVYTLPAAMPHPGWSAYSTLTGYHALIIAQNEDTHTPLCVTEFGWASTEGLAAAPNVAYAYDNSRAEQAQYTVDAFLMLHHWEWVQMAFLSNLDYILVGSPPDRPAFMSIITAEGDPQAAFDAIRNMPKPP